MPSRGRAECHESPGATFLSAVTMHRESVGNKRRDIMKAHPTVCGPWDTAALMPQSLSISTDSAYERHGYTLPILARFKGLSTAAGRCVCNKRDLLNGQSSPGTLQVGQHPSKGTRQIPHTSSSGSPFSSVLPVSHCHWAMACHFLTMTFMVWVRETRLFVFVYATRPRHFRTELLLLHVNVPCCQRVASDVVERREDTRDWEGIVGMARWCAAGWQRWLV